MTKNEHLKAMRLARGFSQLELGKATGLSKQNVSNYETGRFAATDAICAKWADACGYVYEVDWRFKKK